MRLADPVRFAVGTLTRVPVAPPRRLDGAVAGRGLVLAPVVAAGIGLASGLPLLVAGPDAEAGAALLAAGVVVGLAAWLSRGLHWDGLADLADGLGSGAPPEVARQIMRRSEVGAIGVLALVLTVLIQVAGLASLPPGPPALGAWVVTLAVSRWALVICCGPWFAAARSSRLGARVIGSATPARLFLASAATVLITLLAGTASQLPLPLALGACLPAALLAAVGVNRVAARRLGGSTGDVLGASVELAAAAALLALAVGW